MKTVVDRFIDIVQKTPNALAAITDQQTWTYKALELRSRQIANAIEKWFLDEFGRRVEPGDIIGISLDKDADLLASMIGILSKPPTPLPPPYLL